MRLDYNYRRPHTGKSKTPENQVREFAFPLGITHLEGSQTQLEFLNNWGAKLGDKLGKVSADVMLIRVVSTEGI